MADKNITKKAAKEQARPTIDANFCVKNFGMPAKQLISICQKLNTLKTMGHNPEDVLQSIIDKEG